METQDTILRWPFGVDVILNQTADKFIAADIENSTSRF